MATIPRMDMILYLMLPYSWILKPKQSLCANVQCLLCQDNSIELADFSSLLHEGKHSSRLWKICFQIRNYSVIVWIGQQDVPLVEFALFILEPRLIPRTLTGVQNCCEGIIASWLWKHLLFKSMLLDFAIGGGSSLKIITLFGTWLHLLSLYQSLFNTESTCLHLIDLFWVVPETT